MQRIGIVVPTMPEQGPLLAFLEERTGTQSQAIKQRIWRIYRVEMGSLLISIIHSGPGMVNAAAASEALIAYEEPEVVLNYGIAGAHTHEALPGDIIVATHVCAPFNGYLQTGGVLKSTFGIRWDDEGIEVFEQRVTQRYASLPCEPTLVALALQAAQVLGEEHIMTIVAPPGQKVRPARIFSGVIASADTYCRDEATFANIHATFGSLSEDMESAAVGQIATRHGLPFAIVRCLSNNDLLEVLTLERKQLIYPEMARRSAMVITRLLQLLAQANR